MSLILTWGANVARFGVVTPIAMHAAFNTVSRFVSGLFTQTQPHAPIPFELVLALSGIAAAMVLIVITRGRLGYHPVGGLTQLAAQQRTGADGAELTQGAPRLSADR